MRREEALNRKSGWMYENDLMVAFSEEKLISHINKIYDDFESSTCVSCKYLCREYCEILDIEIMSIVNQSCKGWEAKDDSK